MGFRTLLLDRIVVGQSITVLKCDAILFHSKYCRMKVSMLLEGMGTVKSKPSFTSFGDIGFESFELSYTGKTVFVRGATSYLVYNPSFKLLLVEGVYKMRLFNEDIELMFRLGSVTTSTRLYRWIKSNGMEVNLVKS